MKKSSSGLWILLIGFFTVSLLAACATLPKAQPGLYVNEQHRFSVSYPEKWQHQQFQSKSEVLRVANPNQWKIPVLTASVVDLPKGANLKNAAKAWVAAVKTSYPKTKRHKILSQEMITLEDGTPAAAYTAKWTWADGVTKLQTAAVTAFKGTKSITTTATTVLGGQTTPDKLLAMCRTLKFYKKGLFGF
jgi:hypothetical protein